MSTNRNVSLSLSKQAPRVLFFVVVSYVYGLNNRKEKGDQAIFSLN